MVRKLYTDKEYSDKACEANAQGKKLIKVQEEREYEVEVLEWEKKTIEVPIYNEEGEIIGYESIEVDDYTKPIIDAETGEQKYHIETRTEIVEYLEIVDNPENFARCFFNTSLGYVRRKAFVKETGEYKDFLADMLAGMEVGQKIITYNQDLQPSFQLVTAEFIQECKDQYNNDFYGG
jgi:hypothetical protein